MTKNIPDIVFAKWAKDKSEELDQARVVVELAFFIALLVLILNRLFELTSVFHSVLCVCVLWGFFLALLLYKEALYVYEKNRVFENSLQLLLGKLWLTVP